MCARSRAGVTQLAECQLPKLNVAGSNPVSRSSPPLRPARARSCREASGRCTRTTPSETAGDSTWPPTPVEPLKGGTRNPPLAAKPAADD